MKLKRNLGTSGRLLRLVIAVGLFADAVHQKNWIALGVALFVLMEAALGWCIIYQLLGKNSCPSKRD